MDAVAAAPPLPPNGFDAAPPLSFYFLESLCGAESFLGVCYESPTAPGQAFKIEKKIFGAPSLRIAVLISECPRSFDLNDDFIPDPLYNTEVLAPVQPKKKKRYP